MSSAFIRESEHQNLNEIEPTLSALQFYLRRENGGRHIQELKSYFSEKLNQEVYEMSDGLAYAINSDGKWAVVL